MYQAYDDTSGGNYGIGRRTYMRNDAGNTGYKYDGRGRLTDRFDVINGSGNFRTSYSYNSADLVTYMTYPADNAYGMGETVGLTYNAQMLLTSLYSDYTYVKGVNYDAAGRMDLLSLGQNGSDPRVNIDYVYNGWGTQGGRLQQLKGGTVPNPTSLQSLTYSYDNNGNVLTILDAVNSNQKQCYGYDTLNRLISAKVGQNDANCTGSVGNGEYPDETYGYNTTTGNLESKTGNGTYTYNATHLHAVASTSGNGYSYGYDANGNMTSRNVGTSYTYGYDAENRLTTVSGGTSASFVYDADGVRVKGTAGGVTTTYVGNYFEWKTSTSDMVKYYYAGSQRVAMRTGSNTPLWLLGDHLGSTSQVANYDGSAYTNGNQLYKPWGEKRYPTGASGLPTTYRYTGQRQESSLGGSDGLYYYGARWYDSQLGRWAQPDTILPQSQGTQAWDRLAYVNNNPVAHNDPSGHGECDGIQDPKRRKSCQDANAAAPTTNPNPTPTPAPGTSATPAAAPVQTPPPASPIPTTTPTATPPITPCPASTPIPCTAAPSGIDTDVGADTFSGAYNIVKDIDEATNQGIAAYKVKNLFPGIGVEAGIMAGVQLYADADNNLNAVQRIFRAGIVGMESYGIDQASTVAGGAGFMKAGPVGYFAASFTAGTSLDLLADKINSILFPIFGLGDY